MGTSLPPHRRPQALTALLLLSTGAVCLSGCWVSTEQGRAFEADIVKLKAEYQQQHKDLLDEAARGEKERERLHTEQTDAIKRLDAKLQEVSGALEGLNHAARKTGADLAVDLEKAQKDVDGLRGLLEELQAKNVNLDKGLDSFRTETQAKLAAADNKFTALDAKIKEFDEAQKRAQHPETKDGLYDLAKQKLDAASYEESRTLFTEFLQKWGDDTRAANAQYWIGESYYAEHNYKQAGLSFKKVQDQYPKSDKVPDALLKLAYTFVELGLQDEAKLFLEEVQREFPKSNAAKIAKEKLSELGKKSK